MKSTNYLHDKDIPEILRKFFIYSQTVQGKSEKTIQEYFFDLRLYLRFLVKNENQLDIPINDISINHVDIEFIKKINLDDTLEFLSFLANERAKHHKSEHSVLGISSTSRARKISSIRSFFNYLVDKVHLLDSSPISNLDLPKKDKTLPKYLTLDESMELLNNVDGQFKDRDLCILLLFLSCGLRVSELAGINISDINGESLLIRGKGNKERVVFMNNNCIYSIDTYLKTRISPNERDRDALFISRQGNRINVQTVKWLVKKYSSGINKEVSPHKLRHTAATLMYSNGLDIRSLQEVLGHKNLDTTMIYTHIDNASLRSAASINPISNIVLNSDENNRK